MGERERKIAAAFALGPWPGSRGRCPSCFGTQVQCEPIPDALRRGALYGREIAVCACGAAWEPICEFRPGPREQDDKEAWERKIQALHEGGIFYCHKGGDGRVICPRCAAKLETHGDLCTANLYDLCPGFWAIEIAAMRDARKKAR